MIMWAKRTFINYKAPYKRERPLMLLYKGAYILPVATPMALSLSPVWRKKEVNIFQASLVFEIECTENTWHLLGAQKMIAIMILFLWGNREEVGWVMVMGWQWGMI